MFYTFDERGNVSQRLDSNGNVLSSDLYDAYGAKASPLSDPFGYRGEEGYYTDTETGLLYLHQRYYDPGTGRFLTRDPMGYGGGINLYGYTGNNPVNNSDPSGLSSDPNGTDDDGNPNWINSPNNSGEIGAAASGARHNPVYQCGSPQRDAFANWIRQLPGPGLVEMGITALTGNDYIAGTKASASGRGWDVFGTALSIIPGGGEAGAEGRAGVHAADKEVEALTQNIVQKDVGYFPTTPEEMDEMMGFEGERWPDIDMGTGEPKPGRGRVTWEQTTPNGKVKVTYEQHPYDVGAPDYHTGPHWHVVWPGVPRGSHPRYGSGDPFPE